MNKLRIFESYGVYISIKFRSNLNREPQWQFVIETVEDCLFCSGVFGRYEECELEALKKAVEYI